MAEGTTRAGAIEIKEATIVSGSGRAESIVPQIIELNLYEDIFEHFLTGNCRARIPSVDRGDAGIGRERRRVLSGILHLLGLRQDHRLPDLRLLHACLYLERSHRRHERSAFKDLSGNE